MDYCVAYSKENDGVANIKSNTMRLIRDGHFPHLIIFELKQQQNAKRFCLICSVCEVEEDTRHTMNINTPSMFSIKKQVMSHCDKSKLPSHNTVSIPTIIKVEGCENLTCFEFIHLKSNKELW